MSDASSGNDVPSATTVTPIIKSETPNNFASLDALSISMSLPFTNSNIETMNVIASINFVPHYKMDMNHSV